MKNKSSILIICITLLMLTIFSACTEKPDNIPETPTESSTTDSTVSSSGDPTEQDKTTEPFSKSLEYTLNGDAYCVSGIGTCTDTVIIIPEIYNDLPVNAIGKDVFQQNTSIAEIRIPGSVKTIEDYSFEGCTSLSKVVLGKGVHKIGGAAFRGCTSLTEISLPESLMYIKYSAFQNCTALKNVTLGVSVLEIGDLAFGGCTALTEITIPNSASDLGSSIFAGCSALTSIVLSEGVETIGDMAFENCGLTSITVPSTVKKLGNNCFGGCKDLLEIHYNGTMAQWKAIKKGNMMYLECGTTGAICTDGSTSY